MKNTNLYITEFEMYKVSVCLATYNGEKYIHEQLSGILKQIGDEDEVVISDDGSTDSTLDIIESFNDKRIKVFFNFSTVKRKDYGTILMKIFLNFKNSIMHSTGDIIFLSDQDDVWFDNKYNTIMERFKSYRNTRLVVHNALISSNSKENGLDLFSVTCKPTNSVLEILKNNSYLGCCMTFKREIANRAFDNNYLVIPHDTWLALITCSKYSNSIDIINEPLMYYRVHGSNNSFFIKSNNSLLFKILYRIKLMYYLIKLK